ncbi:acyltransferase [Parageobacillus sp. VR-IP]|uniref:acyltransferase n=1 Tax=Parageobacillus sp. VR-IP TaxID=2742205 RepID=UPI00158358C8|nr:acyltransferase [Parageobacillus sp. VR-IP]NUK29893.1 acyltransferase [Parageobacillus sp. VR-IP]
MNSIYMIARKIYIHIFSIIYTFFLKLIGVKIGKNNLFLSKIIIRGNPKNIVIGNRCRIQKGVCFNVIRDGKIILGDDVLIGDYTIISSSSNIKIDNGTECAAFCYIVDHDHDTRFTNSVGQDIYIGENTWLGTKVTILKGVSIHKESVVGANSVVTKSFSSTSLIAGTPAKLIKELR